MEAAGHVPYVALEDVLCTMDMVRAAVGLAVAKVLRLAKHVSCNGFMVLDGLFYDNCFRVGLNRSFGR